MPADIGIKLDHLCVSFYMVILKTYFVHNLSVLFHHSAVDTQVIGTVSSVCFYFVSCQYSWTVDINHSSYVQYVIQILAKCLVATVFLCTGIVSLEYMVHQFPGRGKS